MMGVGGIFLPAVLWAFTISTEYKVGDEVYTNIDVEQHKLFQNYVQKEKGFHELPPEETVEGKALIKQYLTLNRMRLNALEREELYQMHLQRMQASPEAFEAYLHTQQISKQDFIEEIAYRKEVSRWMMQSYAWKEVVTPQDLKRLKAVIMQQALAHQLISFEVIKCDSKDRIGQEGKEAFWKGHAQEATLFKQVAWKQVPEPYEAFLKRHQTGDISEPIEAFGSWHVIRIVDKAPIVLPPDDVLRHMVLEEKCMKHLSPWVQQQLAWMYKEH